MWDHIFIHFRNDGKYFQIFSNQEMGGGSQLVKIRRVSFKVKGNMYNISTLLLKLTLQSYQKTSQGVPFVHSDSMQVFMHS